MEDKYFYRQIVDELPLPVYVFQDGDLVFVNQALIDYLGYDRGEISRLDFLDLIQPDYRDTLLAQTKAALSGQRTNLPEELELRVLPRNGEIRSIRIKPRVITYNGQPAVLGVVIDITGYKSYLPLGLKISNH